MSSFDLYDELIDEIPENLKIIDYYSGSTWSYVISEEMEMGMAMTTRISTIPFSYEVEQFKKLSLKEMAKLSKSFNFVEASLGVAAINCYHNNSKRVKNYDFIDLNKSNGTKGAFDTYADEVNGKKVAVIGHFPFIEKKFDGICDLSIIERQPEYGDYPDSASEYILPNMDYVFITGCTMVNKTLPRLLELSKNAKVIIVGPSSPITPIMKKYGVYGISGIQVDDNEKMKLHLNSGQAMKALKTGVMVDYLI